MYLDFNRKQEILEKKDAAERLTETIAVLMHEIEILQMQREIQMKVKTNLDKTQKEFILREHIKTLREELDDKTEEDDEASAYMARIAESGMPAEQTEKMEREVRRLARTPQHSAEAAVIRDYLETALDLPWRKKTKENPNLAVAERILEKDHYGLTKVKERIMEFLAVKHNTSGGAAETPILCLVGPPGVGKSSVAKSVARALKRKFIRVSLGGVRDEADIRGHRKTYIGAMPGRVLYAMKQAKVTNPLILLDELDKMNEDARGNPAAALLEVLDQEQNNSFRDHYLEMDYDLSGVFFICTANSADRIPQPLADRLEIIPLSSYTENEKLHIAVKYLYPRQIKKHGLKRSQLRIDENAIKEMILSYTREAGVRELERMIAKLCRKAVKAVVMDRKPAVGVTKENLADYLGKPQYRRRQKEEAPQTGVCTGLAWTAMGGDTLAVEVNTMKGAGKFELTGNMGQVMKESAQAAVSYVRSRAGDLGINGKFYKDTDIHIHIPEGSVPKDGPSAGITMAAALTSALSGSLISDDVAMTGEITIRGRVLPVGGLKEKILAAKNAGITSVILPAENKNDVSEIEDEITSGLNLHYVKEMDEVLRIALKP